MYPTLTVLSMHYFDKNDTEAYVFIKKIDKGIKLPHEIVVKL